MNINHSGTLYIVATPIGNLQDMSLRAIEILKQVDVVAAEDTRHSLSLLQHFSVSTSLFSLHEHNERENASILLDRLKRGESVALISDAGTPLISDPGFFLVREAHALGIRVVPIPGACAAIAALSVSGLPTDRFVFEGFLPVKAKARQERLKALCDESRTLIFYEAPHRIMAMLEDMKLILGENRRVVLTRELTKKFETIHADVLSAVIEWMKKDSNQQRGEMVILVAGAEEQMSHSAAEETLTVLLAYLPLKQAVEVAAKITGERKNRLYELALQLRS